MADLFGIGYEIWAFFVLIGFAVFYLLFKRNIKGIPVILKWIYKNGSAIQLRAQQDLGGIFVFVTNARGKKLETLKQTGLPIEVSIVPNRFRAYVETDALDNPEYKTTLTELKKKGFKVSPQPDKKRGRIKAYLVEKEASLVKVLAFLDVSLGGMKRVREFAAIEGTGETIDWLPRIKKVGDKDPGNSVVIHEMRAAAKSFLQMWADAVKGTIASLILPIGVGIGIGVTIMTVLSIVTGHPL